MSKKNKHKTKAANGNRVSYKRMHKQRSPVPTSVAAKTDAPAFIVASAVSTDSLVPAALTTPVDTTADLSATDTTRASALIELPSGVAPVCSVEPCEGANESSVEESKPAQVSVECNGKAVPAQLLPPPREPRVRGAARQKNRNMTIEKKEMFERCRLRFLRFMTNSFEVEADSPEEQRSRTIGKAVELAVETCDASERDSIIRMELASLPADLQETAMAEVHKAVTAADVLYGVTNSLRQSQWSYTDVETGWTLRAKPDEVQYELLPDGSWLVKVIDDKHSNRVTSRHRRQLQFFGLVVMMSIDKQIAESGVKGVRYKLELIVRLLGDIEAENADVPSSVQREFKVHSSYGSLRFQLFREVRRVCLEIDKAYSERNFPGRLGWDCEKCKFSKGCPVFASAITSADVAETLVRIA